MTEALEIASRAVRLYAETHPRPPHVTQRQAADMLHLSAPTVGRLVKSGKLSLNAAGLIPIGQIDALLEADKFAA
jgi:DNA-binding transcriptional regulator LsrR (DeoR family)